MASNVPLKPMMMMQKPLAGRPKLPATAAAAAAGNGAPKKEPKERRNVDARLHGLAMEVVDYLLDVKRCTTTDTVKVLTGRAVSSRATLYRRISLRDEHKNKRQKQQLTQQRQSQHATQPLTPQQQQEQELLHQRLQQQLQEQLQQHLQQHLASQGGVTPVAAVAAASDPEPSERDVDAAVDAAVATAMDVDHAAFAAAASTDALPTDSAIGLADDVSSLDPSLPFRFEPTMTLESLRRASVELAAANAPQEVLTPRNLLFALTRALGDVTAVFQWKSDSLAVSEWTPADRSRLSFALGRLLLFLVLLADACRIDLPAVAHTKMLKNARKYPQTHVIEPLVVPPEILNAVSMQQQQQQQQASTGASMAFQFDDASPLELFRLKTVHFADERGWAPNLSPRNLLLALTAEAGELCEIFQWKGDNAAPPQAWGVGEREHLGEELSDVLLYLVQLADRSFADLATAARNAVATSANQFPA